jgi:Flp pilus assembly pilin Flp
MSLDAQAGELQLIVHKSRKERIMSTSLLKALWQEEDGQDLVEYSLLLAFIALGAIALLSSTSKSLNSLWAVISNTLSSAAASAS